MNNDLIKEKLEKIKEDKAFDTEFANLLLDSYLEHEDGETIAKKVISKISKRYVENQKS